MILMLLCYQQLDSKKKTDVSIFILLFVENGLLYDTIHDFSLWFRTGSKLADINRF